MRKITCYRRGCQNKATHELPGTPTLHLCTACLKRLYPDAVVYKREPQQNFGPNEFKEDTDVQAEENE